MIRRRYTFYGSVQGVGFRWVAKHAANSSGCTGWARNEWDGSVTMELQGEENMIDSVVMAVRNGRFIEVERMDTRNVPVEPDEYGFETY